MNAFFTLLSSVCVSFFPRKYQMRVMIRAVSNEMWCSMNVHVSFFIQKFSNQRIFYYMKFWTVSFSFADSMQFLVVAMNCARFSSHFDLIFVFVFFLFKEEKYMQSFGKQFSNGEIMFGKSVIFELSTETRVVAIFGTGTVPFISQLFPKAFNPIAPEQLKSMNNNCSEISVAQKMKWLGAGEQASWQRGKRRNQM